MATGAVVTTAYEQQNDNQQDQDEGDHPKDPYPARCAGSRSVAGLKAGLVAGVAVRVGV